MLNYSNCLRQEQLFTIVDYVDSRRAKQNNLAQSRTKAQRVSRHCEVVSRRHATDSLLLVVIQSSVTPEQISRVPRTQVLSALSGEVEQKLSVLLRMRRQRAVTVIFVAKSSSEKSYLAFTDKNSVAVIGLLWRLALKLCIARLHHRKDCCHLLLRWCLRLA